MRLSSITILVPLVLIDILLEADPCRPSVVCLWATGCHQTSFDKTE